MQDLKFAFRQLLKNPGFTAVAAGTLAIGIGANSALFSVIQRVLLTPLPFVEPDRLVMVQETDLANGIVEGSVSGPNFSDWRERSRCFTALTAVQFNCTFNMSGLGEPVPLRGALVTPGFFDVFPMPSMSLGRPFRPDEAEEGNTRRVILSHALWQRRFGSESNIVGQTLTLDGRHTTWWGLPGRLWASLKN
jgi:putative ABC transport system permease protein